MENTQPVQTKQTTENTAPEKTVNLANLTADDSLSLIWNALNKASNQGVFTIDESYVIKVAHNKLRNNMTTNNEVSETV